MLRYILSVAVAYLSTATKDLLGKGQVKGSGESCGDRHDSFLIGTVVP